MKALLALAALALAITTGASSAVLARQDHPTGPTLDVIEVQPNFYMIAGAGGNIAVQLGRDGVVVVDTGSVESASAVLAALRTLSPLPIRYIINTADDDDHVGGNEPLARAGASLFGGPNLGPGGAANTIINNGGAASIVATENTFLRLSGATGQTSRFASVAWPTETFARGQKTIRLNDEGIQILRHTAHTDGDAVVLFRRADVIVAGDIFDMTRFPLIDLARGGSIQGEIDALNALMDLAIPSIPMPWKSGGTVIVPGHGRLAEQAEVVEYRDMVTIIRDRIQEMSNNRMTLDQIKAASPTTGWNRRFGADSGPWTTDMFVEAIFKSLTAKKTE
jgi:glyoxylase-like metal-dependent hydrolase (beta-lactamase superfamily II)